ncbi:hypothetical protein LN42_01825 [Marinitoga sp. 1137]|uniref:helix-turn-helix transcriptional regulator n=1 Tax=Marinitoga sp. 1137 TaxID=1545835 RepID=UPI0009503D76|nr:helix-turn-helix transcriptional regulator [Marinitoga sp. 1137]APT75269.1 hypothetical protein LN42_01825 [Marinitoga sp. 1137]
MRNNLKYYRELKGLTTRELAKRSNVSQAHIVFIEQGKRAPTIPIARRIAKALDCELNEIFPEEYEHSKV